MIQQSEIIRRVSDAQESCVYAWRREFGGKGLLYSRGCWLSGVVEGKDGKHVTIFEGETRKWEKRTAKDLQEALQFIMSQGKVVKFLIFGGYDWATCMQAYRQHREYDPLVCEWEIELTLADFGLTQEAV